MVCGEPLAVRVETDAEVSSVWTIINGNTADDFASRDFYGLQLPSLIPLEKCVYEVTAGVQLSGGDSCEEQPIPGAIRTAQTDTLLPKVDDGLAVK
jgi:hypothetical protein